MYVSTMPALGNLPLQPWAIRRQRRPVYLGQSVPGTIVRSGAAAGTAAAVPAAASSIATSTGLALGPVTAGLSIVAGALTALIGGLFAAHALRAKQAKDENSAMNIGVQGFDSDLAKVQQAYNSGQIDAAGAIQAVGIILQNYWALVTPHIQPGRNGCSGGANCASSNFAKNYCSGNIGAACCAGCAVLNQGINGPQGVIAAINGTSTLGNNPANKNTAYIPEVYASKYGGQNRAAYNLVFQQNASPGGLGALTTSTIAGIPMWVLLAGGLGLILFFMFAMRG